MTNPLLDKFYELHPEKKEKPKVIKAENAKVAIKSYDPDSLKETFQQVAEQLQTGKARVLSMNMEMGDFTGLSTSKTITFEVMVYE